MKRKISSYEIALAGLSCALSTILLIVGVYAEILLFSAYLFGSVALMLPLARNSYWGYFLSYIGTCILVLLFAFARFFDFLPFIMFFGLHPLVNELQLKTKINRWVACFIKALWFDLTMYLIWRFVFAGATGLGFLDAYVVPLLLVGGTLFFVLYDYLVYRWRANINVLVARIIRKK